jgi:hypothetical protein
MLTRLKKPILAALLLAGLGAWIPPLAPAATQPMAARTEKPPKPKSQRLTGEILQVNPAAMIFTMKIDRQPGMIARMGINANTRLTKAGKSAILADFRPGDQASVSYLAFPNGAIMASKVVVKKTKPPPAATKRSSPKTSRKPAH